MRIGYIHGPISCRDCFNEDGEVLAEGDWRLINNPGYYGSSNPEILLLGFSKGANQNRAAQEGDFDTIAFAKARPRLQRILGALGLMPPERSIDDLMTAKEKQFGVASLVRCSLCKMRNGECKTSGNVVSSALSNQWTKKIVQRCAENYLGNLPANTRLVVLLGNDERYLARSKPVFKKLYRDYSELPDNPLGFRAGGALWIYAAHPSPGNGCFDAWLNAGQHVQQGSKRLKAIAALKEFRISP